MASKIVVTVISVEGVCSAGLKVGDRMVISPPKIDTSLSDNMCLNGLSSLMPFLRQWSTPEVPRNARSVICCPDPGPENKGRGHVLFEIEKES